MALWKRWEEAGYHQSAGSVSVTTAWTSFCRRKLNLFSFFFRDAEVGRLFDHCLAESARVVPRTSHRAQCVQSHSRHSGTEVSSTQLPPPPSQTLRHNHTLRSCHTAKFKVLPFSVCDATTDVQFSGIQFRRAFFAPLFLSVIRV
jgi:hypothetical protein